MGIPPGGFCPHGFSDTITLTFSLKMTIESQPKSRSNKLPLKREGIGTADQERTCFLEKSQERKTFHWVFFHLRSC